jgi:tetratricopeptide (TPR) repeat protein
MPQAKAAALRALVLDESLAEAHTALGWYLNYYEWDRIGAEKSFCRAIELNPNYATAHDWLGAENLATRKRVDEALVFQRRAEERDPLSPIISANVGWTLFFARRYDEAIAQNNRTLSLDPNFFIAHSNLCWAYNAKGMYREAIAECRKARELNDDSFLKGYHALVLARSGQREEATKLLNQLKQESAQNYVTSYAIALAHIGLNEKEQAFVWLEKEVAERGYWAGVYAVDPVLDDLRSDPRFKEMLKRLNLPE